MADEVWKPLREAALRATLSAMRRYGISLSEVKDPEVREELRKLIKRQETNSWL